MICCDVCSEWFDIDAIARAISQVASDRCPKLEGKAQQVANKHSKALLLSSNCHHQFNSSRHFTEVEVTDLRKCSTAK